MFTQEEFESAYEIVSGFNNIRKQITGDPKLLTELYKFTAVQRKILRHDLN